MGDTERTIEELFAKYPALRAIHENPNLSPFQRKLRAAPILRGLREEMLDREKEAAKLNERAQYMRSVIGAVEKLEAWKILPPKLEKNDCSRLHQLIAGLRMMHRHLPETTRNGDPNDFPWKEVNPFVVQHDWASAFKNATDYDEGTFKLPYEMCAFEFRISGASVTVLAMQQDEQPAKFQFYAGIDGLWLTEDKEPSYPAAYTFAKDQIKAICVALEADVATRHMERVSEKVNRKREQEGREPFFSYHIVSLNRRFRASNPSRGGVPTTHKRLHFRRGHWRHYESFKTWVRWCLVGDPELGFIEKEYRL